jgi:alkanesulfonate monooxygenase SsuD/methylene tetrahydromethanopterin reductase-like flavin-dependent oxidoreductase (luciferase family)
MNTKHFQKSNEFVGVVYDLIEDVRIEISPIIRRTWEEAFADAKELLSVVNDQAAYEDEQDGRNTTVGRVDDSYACVQCAWGIEDEDAKKDREFDERTDREELAAMGRGPQDDTPSLPAPHGIAGGAA